MEFLPPLITLSVILSLVSAVKENQIQEVHGNKPKDAQESDYNGSRDSPCLNHGNNGSHKKYKCYKTYHQNGIEQDTQKKLVEHISVKSDLKNLFSVSDAVFHFLFLQIVFVLWCCLSTMLY